MLPAFGSILISIVGAVSFSFTTFDMKDTAKERSNFLNDKIDRLSQDQKDAHQEVMQELLRLEQKIYRARK